MMGPGWMRTKRFLYLSLRRENPLCEGMWEVLHLLQETPPWCECRVFSVGIQIDWKKERSFLNEINFLTWLDSFQALWWRFLLPVVSFDQFLIVLQRFFLLSKIVLLKLLFYITVWVLNFPLIISPLFLYFCFIKTGNWFWLNNLLARHNNYCLQKVWS